MLCIHSWQAETRQRLGQGEGKGGVRFVIGPIDHKLGHILYRVFEVKMIPVAIVIHAWPMPGIKLDAIGIVPKFYSRVLVSFAVRLCRARQSLTQHRRGGTEGRGGGGILGM